ncbi:glycoside hydrolase family 5 protein [Nonomuraea turcica]|uniref:glycoside hydrolase family 5 protein n=1 Tax=Nonomuraea sp. G32 TaxID=3067274 RepID=UPI00273AF57F|nr:cellulase family glycosylhydrolase [Nonomuraea sp. G32]MDP4503347.1 hypothetical protein [Nonomuraea sp. G32]
MAGYNPANEPGDPTDTVIGPSYTRLERAIRAVDGRHVLFLDGNRYSTDFSMLGDPFPNTVYTAHDYLRRTAFMRRTGTPIWIGEFGPVYDGDPERDRSRLRLLRDQLGIYREHGASWSLWTYKNIGPSGTFWTRSTSRSSAVCSASARRASGSSPTRRRSRGHRPAAAAANSSRSRRYPWCMTYMPDTSTGLAVVDESIVGDAGPDPLMAREQFQRLPAFARAAAGDPEIAQAWEEYQRRRYANTRVIMESFAHMLRPGMTVERATEIHWAVTNERTE